MSATLTLDLFRPSILDLVEEGAPLHSPDVAHDRQPERITVPTEPAGGDHDVRVTRATQGGGPTLDDLMVGVWEGLTARRTVACLACGGAMMPRYSAGPVPVGGRCTGCGSTVA
jgi:hypothetical protein